MGGPRYGREARRTIRADIGLAAARGDDVVTSDHLLLGVADVPGPGALVLERPRLSHEARVAIEAAAPVAGDHRARTITSAHVLAGLAVSRPSRARALLGHLDVDPTEVLRLVGEIDRDG